MAIRPDWNIGTITLTASSANFTTTGAMLQTAAIEPGDAIITPSGAVLVISSITGQNSGTLMLPCPAGAAGTSMPLRIRFQPDGSRFQAAYKAAAYLLSGGNVDALAGLTGAADTMPYFTGAGTMARTGLTALARTFLSRTTGAGMYGDLGEIPNANLPARLQAGSPNIGDANAATENGFYHSNNTSTNVPDGSPAIVLNVRYSATGGYQRWVSLTGTSVYERRQSGGVWPAWMRVDIEGARGSSSGRFTVPSSGGNIIVQFGTTTASTDSGGFGDFALPVSYPTAQITSIMITGNMNASSAVLGPRTGPSDLSTSSVFFRSLTTSALIRINYVSFGY